MTNPLFHTGDLSEFRVLITGGAGFIGSHLAAYLVENGAGKVTVVDDLSTGSRENIEGLSDQVGFSFFERDINDFEFMKEQCGEHDFVLHQAAIGSVPRSLKDPLTTHGANATGFLSVLEACRLTGVKKLVYASSSSVYGDLEDMPKVEQNIGNPKSPYAISKLIDEQYARLYTTLYGMDIVGLRYFNIFGPRQQPNGPYAAAIPLFILAALKGDSPTVYGDGSQTRDFTFVSNAVQANIKALFQQRPIVPRVYNIACGRQYSLLDIIDMIGNILDTKMEVIHQPARVGDIKHSLADINLARKDLGYMPDDDMRAGLTSAIDWYQGQLNYKF